MGLGLGRLFHPILVLFGLSKKPQESVYVEETPVEPIEGTHGLIDAEGVIAREKDKIALIIDYEFADLPVWVEWDVDLQQISIAQNGGAVAILNTILTEKQAKDFESTDKLLLCTNIGEERVVHTLPLILRNSNDNDVTIEENMAGFGKELAVGAVTTK
ncbi:MAG: hypothetical protein H6855_01170 [Rhodospirillales bacterium]|nr:hypothetical protein [Rhodospirillales bacterium]MCB9964680.1 hypothetical protein [Rhodospirillales bacterium]MCB9979970.1 hypothetical protein [Rhodospirillales bacterium]